jgi:hypothetical protein
MVFTSIASCRTWGCWAYLRHSPKWFWKLPSSWNTRVNHYLLTCWKLRPLCLWKNRVKLPKYSFKERFSFVILCIYSMYRLENKLCNMWYVHCTHKNAYVIFFVELIKGWDFFCNCFICSVRIHYFFFYLCIFAHSQLVRIEKTF